MKAGPAGEAREDVGRLQVFAFRPTDRLAKGQLPAISSLQENFARDVAASLASLLRTDVAANLISVEESSFVEFTRSLPSPTTLIALHTKPFASGAMLEIDSSLVFSILEILLGGTGGMSAQIDRRLTEVEESVLEGPIEAILQDLRVAWLPLAPMEFAVAGYEPEPQLSQILAPDDDVVAVRIEVHIGVIAKGAMNFAIPSVILKQQRQTLRQESNAGKESSTEADQAGILRLLEPAMLQVDARLDGPTVGVETLLALKEGDVLVFDYPVERLLDLTINGKVKYRGEMIGAGRKRALQISQIFETLLASSIHQAQTPPSVSSAVKPLPASIIPGDKDKLFETPRTG